MTLYVLVAEGRIASGEKVIEDRPGMLDLTEEQRNALGWFAVVDQPPAYDPAKQTLTKGDLALINGGPIRQYTVTDLPLPPLPDLIAARQDEVSQLLLDKSGAGVKIPNVPAPIQVRDGDRANIDGQALFATLAKSAALQWPADSYWRLADNSNYPLQTADAMIGFAAAIAGAYLALRKASWAHKDALAALKSPDEVAAYDITAGW